MKSWMKKVLILFALLLQMDCINHNCACTEARSGPHDNKDQKSEITQDGDNQNLDSINEEQDKEGAYEEEEE